MSEEVYLDKVDSKGSSDETISVGGEPHDDKLSEEFNDDDESTI